MYALIKNSVVVKYPYGIGELKRDNPNVSFPTTLSDSLLAEFDVQRVFFSNQPVISSSEISEELSPVFDTGADRWVQAWAVRNKTDAENQADLDSLQSNIVSQVQDRLDTFAQSRNYDGILSACTYATSEIAKFAGEGQCCVSARDLTWLKLYEILAEIVSGTRPVPTGYADIAAELPVLVWPI
jgi:hypothetical protein